MPYNAEISRKNPTCFLFLIDQSGSMAEPWGGGNVQRKADALADAVNKLLYNLVLRSTKTEEIREWYYVGVIGYGSNRCAPAMLGRPPGHDLVTISDVANYPLRVDERTKKESDGAGGLVERKVKFPIWLDPMADGGTPMCEALRLARDVVEKFVGSYPTCFPPIVVNITDGQASDGDPEQPAAAVRTVESGDGPVLLFNVHVSEKPGRMVEYPDAEGALADEFARLLFRMSSTLPPQMLSLAKQAGYQVGEASRGFVFNADLVSVITFLDLGTRVGQNNLR